jgi:hypothetical protein
VFEPEPEPDLEEGEIMDDQVGGGYELRHNITPVRNAPPESISLQKRRTDPPPEPLPSKKRATKKKNKGVGLPVGFKLLGPRSPPAPAPAPPPASTPSTPLHGFRPGPGPTVSPFGPAPAKQPAAARAPARASTPHLPPVLTQPAKPATARAPAPHPPAATAQLAKPATARAPTPHLPPVPAQPAQPTQGFLSGTIHLAAQPDTARASTPPPPPARAAVVAAARANFFPGLGPSSEPAATQGTPG